MGDEVRIKRYVFYCIILISYNLKRKFSSEQLDELRSCFAIFDVDSSGLISTNELKNVLELLNVKLNNEEVNVLMETIDADHSGQIDFEEFKNLMSDIVLKTPTKAQLEEAFRFFDLGIN